MQNQSTPTARRNARTLRSGMTDTERKLWSGLRGEQMGVKFRRQHPLVNYIADFACLSPKLVVELDGSQHLVRQDYDAVRDAFLQRSGFDVLRFPSNDVFINFEGVLEVVRARLEMLRHACPHPSLPPKGEGASQSQLSSVAAIAGQRQLSSVAAMASQSGLCPFEVGASQRLLSSTTAGAGHNSASSGAAGHSIIPSLAGEEVNFRSNS